MTVKSWEKVNRQIVTNYIIFENMPGRQPVYRESFRVDYLAKSYAERNLDKIIDLEQMGKRATVQHVSINSATGELDVTVYLKGE